MHLTFYEKPGCVGNARQKAVLLAAGHTLDVKDLLNAPHTKEDLRFYSMERLEALGVRLSPGPRLYFFKGDDPDVCPRSRTGFRCDEGRTIEDSDHSD